jgi:hypothetical protein
VEAQITSHGKVIREKSHSRVTERDSYIDRHGDSDRDRDSDNDRDSDRDRAETKKRQREAQNRG